MSDSRICLPNGRSNNRLERPGSRPAAQPERLMAQVRKIDDDAMARRKTRVRRKGRDRAAAFRRKLAGRRHSDSTRLIREDRDR